RTAAFVTFSMKCLLLRTNCASRISAAAGETVMIPGLNLFKVSFRPTKPESRRRRECHLLARDQGPAEYGGGARARGPAPVSCWADSGCPPPPGDLRPPRHTH